MKALSLIFLCVVLSGVLHAQCKSSISVKSANAPLTGQDNGDISVEIKSQGSFESKLFSVDGDNEQRLVSSRNGSGTQEVTFNNLQATGSYKVEVTFLDEEKFPCRKRAVDNIILGTSKQ